MKKLLNSLSFLLLLIIAIGCDKKDDNYPSVLTEFADAEIGSGGMLLSFTTDDGVRHDVSQQGIKTDARDTIIRSVATYADDGSTPRLYGIQAIFASPALPIDSFENVAYAPVSVVSVWQTDRYINMILGVKTSGVERSHAFAFCLDSLGHVSLLHSRADKDKESYTERMYMSLPIYSNMYERDSLTLHINTYAGVNDYVFRK